MLVFLSRGKGVKGTQLKEKADFVVLYIYSPSLNVLINISHNIDLNWVNSLRVLLSVSQIFFLLSFRHFRVCVFFSAKQLFD
jgi:hypothetical protein